MTVECWDGPGFPAASTKVRHTPYDAGHEAERQRLRELFPQRYDNRPLWMRALEIRVEGCV